MNADVLITIVFVAWAFSTAGLTGFLIVRSGFGSQRDARK
jgi:hypothetical protein